MLDCFLAWSNDFLDFLVATVRFTGEQYICVFLELTFRGGWFSTCYTFTPNVATSCR